MIDYATNKPVVACSGTMCPTSQRYRSSINGRNSLPTQRPSVSSSFDVTRLFSRRSACSGPFAGPTRRLLHPHIDGRPYPALPLPVVDLPRVVVLPVASHVKDAHCFDHPVTPATIRMVTPTKVIDENAFLHSVLSRRPLLAGAIRFARPGLESPVRCLLFVELDGACYRDAAEREKATIVAVALSCALRQIATFATVLDATRAGGLGKRIRGVLETNPAFVKPSSNRKTRTTASAMPSGPRPIRRVFESKAPAPDQQQDLSPGRAISNIDLCGRLVRRAPFSSAGSQMAAIAAASASRPGHRARGAEVSTVRQPKMIDAAAAAVRPIL